MKSFNTANPIPTSEILMQTYLHSTSFGTDSMREEWLARQTLLSLMRLVRSEQMMDIHRKVKQLVHDAPCAEPAKRPKSKRGARKQPGQTQLAFGRED